MLRCFLEWLANALGSVPGLALGASFIWGVLSILLSPCHLTSIPLIVGFISGQETTSTKRAFMLALLFSTGILITIGLTGLITALLGRMLGDIGPSGNYLLAAIFVLVGLNLLEVIRLPFTSAPNEKVFQREGLLAALVLGLIFGIALGPCTFAYMAPMLGVVFTVAASRFLYALLLLLVFALGHCSVIVAAGTLTEVVQRYLNWNVRSKGVAIVKKICGVLVILGGVYLLWTA
uniref:Cytochrome C biogenesis protein n=1 Tax=candidate division WOR-3 bacterium TaxID=2052148 RepID=A0A7C1T290_UNCW3